MLLIDDEADNASINIKHGKGEVSKINGQIRDLLDMFERSCYVGYTATPFANIFISPDTDDADAAARTCFRGISSSVLIHPTNYFGASRVFLEDRDAIICHIDDNEDYLPLKHEKDTAGHGAAAQPDRGSPCLRRGAGHPARARSRDRSQLDAGERISIHRCATPASQRDPHPARRHPGQLPGQRRATGQGGMKDPEISALHDVWEKQYADAGSEWSAVQAHFTNAASPIRVVEVNSRSSGTLNYSDHERPD